MQNLLPQRHQVKYLLILKPNSISKQGSFFFDDSAGYQYAFNRKACNGRHSQEGQVLMAFRSNYARSGKRVDTRDSVFH